MSANRQWRGLSALIADAIEHGSVAVERVHKATARRPFAILELIEPIAAPVRAIHTIHDTSVEAVYGMIRLVNRAAGRTVDALLDTLEPTNRSDS